jgi:Acyl-CoA synthetase (NDP forming)
VLAYKNIASLPISPDLARAFACPWIRQLLFIRVTQKGTRAVILLAGGLSAVSPEKASQIKKELLAAANTPDMRILGPHCLGVMVPWLNLNCHYGPHLHFTGAHGIHLTVR